MMDGYPKRTRVPRSRNVQRPTSNAQHQTSRTEFSQLSTLNHQLRHSAARFARTLTAASRSFGMRARESSRQRWNSLRCAKTWDAQRTVSPARTKRKAESGNRKATDAKRLSLKSKIENLKYCATILRTNTS